MTCFTYVPQRWVTVLLGFFGLCNIYAMRVCLSIAITQMVPPADNTMEFVDDTCPQNNSSEPLKNETVLNNQLFDWSEYTQGVILSSFYWGYLFTNLPGGLIAERFGGKYTLGLGILSTAVLTGLTPSCIMWGGSSALICLRVVMGFCEGATYPALSVLLAQWIPEDERAKAASVVFAGSSLGTICSMTLSGLILRYSSIGWPAVFYFFGAMGILNFLINCAFCYSKPSENPFISKIEANYLKEKLKSTDGTLPPTPWRHILRSLPVWAFILGLMGKAWGFLTVSSDMPKYMSSVLRFSVEDNGYFSSLPYLSKWFMSIPASCVFDYLIGSGRFSIGTVRKIGVTIGSIGPGVFIVAVSYAGCNGMLAVSMLTIGMALLGCSTCSILVNPLDLGPNYAGTLMGLANGVSTLCGIVSPYVVGVLTPNQTISEWRTVFWIILIFFVVSNLIFCVFGSGEVQEWNNPKFLEKESSRENDGVKEAVGLLPVK